jgi:hypothetical protein
MSVCIFWGMLQLSSDPLAPSASSNTVRNCRKSRGRYRDERRSLGTLVKGEKGFEGLLGERDLDKKRTIRLSNERRGLGA